MRDTCQRSVGHCANAKHSNDDEWANIANLSRYIGGTVSFRQAISIFGISGDGRNIGCK